MTCYVYTEKVVVGRVSLLKRLYGIVRVISWSVQVASRFGTSIIMIDHYRATHGCGIHLRLCSLYLLYHRSRDSFEVPADASLAMSEQLSPAERYDLATQLITQSPPGQVNDVIAGKSPSCHIVRAEC